jgi:acetoin utilization protein AcuB
MGTRVEEVMTPDPLTLPPSSLVRDAYALMKERGFRHVPIVEGDVLKGIISMTDIGKLGARIPEVLQMVIGDVMTSNLMTVGPDESVDVAAAKMASKKINCLPIVVNEKLVGIVTTYDLLDALARRLRGEEDTPK